VTIPLVREELDSLSMSPHSFVSDRVAAEIIGSTPSTMRRWRYEERGPRYVKCGSTVRYRVSWLKEFLDAHTVETRDSSALSNE
jgi:hypothetical protein